MSNNILRSWRSSVTIVSDYGLDDWAIGFRSPAGENDFSRDFKFSRRRVWSSESSGMYCRVLNWMSTDDNRPDNGGSTYLRNVGRHSIKNTAVHTRRFWTSKDFSSNFCVQTGSEAHPASCPMDTGDPFHGAKRGRGVTLTTHLHLVPRSRMSKSYTTSLPSATMACSGTALIFQ
jgi:hypothetical protein